MIGKVLSRKNLKRASLAVYGELERFNPKLQALYLSTAVQPRLDPRERTNWLRRFGFKLGPETRFEGVPTFSGYSNLFENLQVGCDCEIGANCVLDLEANVTLGDRVTVGQGVMLLTSTHELGPSRHRAGKIMNAPIRILDGAWVQARSIILPGVTIGEGAIVEVGSVVNKDVPTNTRVSGAPAVPLGTLEGE